MSAVFILRQADSVHMMTDAVSYLLDGTVMATNLTKASAMPTLRAAISCPGPASFQRLFANEIEATFDTFDELVLHGQKFLSEAFERYAAEHRGGDAMSAVYLIGWHERNSCPGAYRMTLWTAESTQRDVVLAESGVDAGCAEQSELRPINEGLINGMPMPSVRSIEQSRFEIKDDAAGYVPAVDLLHLTELARQELDSDGLSWVGGKAVLTSVTSSGVTQHVVHHWAEDVIGARIRPRPVDWRAWHAAHPRHVGLSRLQRERLEKRAAKMQRRAGR